jgi:hypothetical protein
MHIMPADFMEAEALDFMDLRKLLGFETHILVALEREKDDPEAGPCDGLGFGDDTEQAVDDFLNLLLRTAATGRDQPRTEIGGRLVCGEGQVVTVQP